MGTIVHLSQYRKPRSVPRRDDAPAAPHSEGAPHYFCLRCDGDRFLLYSSGVVHCAQCNALMRNIRVSDTDQGKAGSK